MKHLKQFFLFLLLASFTVTQAKERVVQLPFYAASTAGTSMEIRQIVLSDTATVFFIETYYKPKNWIRIAEDSYLITNDGKKYPIRSSVDISLGEELYMPESGTASFQLIFPPLPASTREVSFTEGDDPGSFQLWGIRLDGKPFDKFVQQQKKNSKEQPALDQPVIRSGNAVLTGKILHYPKQMHTKLNAHKYDFILNNWDEIEIPVADDGTFRTEIPLIYPVKLTSSHILPAHNIPIFLTPGTETSVTINLPEITRSGSRLLKEMPSLGEKLAFSGKNAALNEEINKHPEWVTPLFETREEMMKMLEDVASMNVEEYKAYILERYENRLRKIDTFTGISEALRRLKTQDLRIETALILVQAQDVLIYARQLASQSESGNASPEEAKIILPDNYYAFIKDFLPNDPIGLYSDNYGNCVQWLAKQQNLPTAPLNISEILGSNQGFIFDLMAMQELAAPIVDYKLISDEALDKAHAINPAFGDLLTAKNNELKAKIEANKKTTGYRMHTDDIKNIPPEELFAAITQSYKGKVVFIDFWATWCGPCMNAMKQAAKVKEEMEAKGVIFLYLTNETSPMAKWQNTIPDIKGEHFRMSGQQWNELSKSFSIQGIPFYLILNKQGDIIYTSTGFMGEDKMREVLNGAVMEN
ncbi:MAG: redoxin family protein [Dysgonamonadaceae bacterium]|jgi:thiol-disulfide isomerase/thioredoxin|nr:redoxin family protein [Dysgonamonadaceae bacterium]